MAWTYAVLLVGWVGSMKAKSEKTIRGEDAAVHNVGSRYLPETIFVAATSQGRGGDDSGPLNQTRKQAGVFRI